MYMDFTMHGLALYADILPLAVARGKLFGIKGQLVVKSAYMYIQAPMNYFRYTCILSAVSFIDGEPTENHRPDQSLTNFIT